MSMIFILIKFINLFNSVVIKSHFFCKQYLYWISSHCQNPKTCKIAEKL